MLKHFFYRFLCAFLPLFGLFTAVFGQYDPTQTYTSLSQAFSPLADLDSPGRTQKIGALNFTRCCLEAVKESYYIDGSGHVQQSPNPTNFLQISAAELANAQWPCGATYNGSSFGAPHVTIPNSWCQSHCGGWQQSSNKNLTQWIQPFVGFILPAAVFCLNVPRRKGLTISDDYFPNHLPDLYTRAVAFLSRTLELLGLSKTGPSTSHAINTNGETEDIQPGEKEKGIETNQEKIPDTAAKAADGSDGNDTNHKASSGDFLNRLSKFIVAFFDFGLYAILVILEMVLRGSAAASIALIDTILWVAVVFSTAGPMIISGLYEAHLDRQVIEELYKITPDKKIDPHNPNRSITPKSTIEVFRYKVHLLYAILVGNLKMDKNLQTGDPHSEIRSSWLDVERLVDLIEPETLDNLEKNEREMTRTRLKSMLGCQVSFGASIGAPVAFFLGSFLFSVFGNLSILGDNDTSHALAFGEWWMTIPHVAVVSGCLLAGNNPNTLEAIFSGIDYWRSGKKGSDSTHSPGEVPRSNSVVGKALESMKPKLNKNLRATVSEFIHSGTRCYTSVYQPVWMWERGRSKREWIKEVQHKYNIESKEADDKLKRAPSREVVLSYIKKQKEKFYVWIDRVQKNDESGGQMRKNGLVPAELTAVDIMDWTFMVLVTTSLMIIPFILAYLTSYYTPTVGLACRTFTFVLYFLFQLWLSALWFWDFSNPEPKEEVLWHNKQKLIPSIYSCLVLFGFIGSMFTTVAGTFMQLIGVYRNCICSLPIYSWHDPNATWVVSTNSTEDIYYAQVYWLSTGIASIVLLILVCYIGWWYQRHWRGRLTRLINAEMATEIIPRLTLGGPGNEYPPAGGLLAETPKPTTGTEPESHGTETDPDQIDNA